MNALSIPRVRRKVAALMVWGHDGKQKYSKQQIERRVEALLERLANGNDLGGRGRPHLHRQVG
jgi:hypothetical protein